MRTTTSPRMVQKAPGNCRWAQDVQRSASKGPAPLESPRGPPELLDPIRKSLAKKLLDYSEDTALRGPAKPFGQECSWSLLDRAPRVVKIMVPKSTPRAACILGVQFAEPKELPRGTVLTGCYEVICRLTPIKPPDFAKSFESNRVPADIHIPRLTSNFRTRP